MLKKILEALGALLEDAPVFYRLIEQMKAWGDSQQAARQHLVSTLSNVVASFERAHAIVLIELSRLAAVKTPDEFREKIGKEIDRDKFYQLFQANEICGHVDQLQADLQSGFGEIKESIVLGTAKKLARALGEFSQGEYTLAQRYQEHLSKTLFSAFSVYTE
ncbi:MAG: hypothetical protein ACOY32_12125 [Thermodesulfobacteriota bacterium]